MSEYTKREISVGLFVALGLCALAYLSLSIGGVSPWARDRYMVSARFASVGDLSRGAVVKLAGVPVGEVERVSLENYAALVEMSIDDSLTLSTDTIASIKTMGLLGEAYVTLSPGGAPDNLEDGGRIGQTEPPFDLFELIEKYAFDTGEQPLSDRETDAGTQRSPFPDPLE